MVPWWGAHHLSAPHHRSGKTSVLPSMLATASAFLICSSTHCGHLHGSGSRLQDDERLEGRIIAVVQLVAHCQIELCQSIMNSSTRICEANICTCAS